MISILTLVIVIIQIILILWVLNSVRKQYKKIDESVYETSVKPIVMGKPVGRDYIVKTTAIFGIIGFILSIISFYVLFNEGATKSWSVLLSFGIVCLFSAYWTAISPKMSKLERGTKKARVFMAKFGKIYLIIFVAIFIAGSFFWKSIPLDNSFQILLITFAAFFIFGVEYSHWKLKRL